MKLHLPSAFMAVLLIFSSLVYSQTSERKGTPGIPGLEESASKGTLATGIYIQPLSEGIQVEDMINQLLGDGVEVYNIQYTGSTLASGIFSNAVSTGVSIDAGVILSSGWAQSILGPNNATNTSNDLGLAGDADLTNIINATTYDASVLEFDFVPSTPTITINYILFSEEYPEYLSFTDVFAFIVNGENIARIPGTTTEVSIGTINHLSNPGYYVSNETGIYNLQADGFTALLTATANVNVGESNHIKFAIADKGDRVWDSWVFLEGNSFTSKGSIIGQLIDSETGLPISGGTVVATGNITGHGNSDINGNYRILGLEFGYGYTVSASAEGYEVVIVEDIDVLEENPQIVKDIYLTPVISDYDIVELTGDPNPVISHVMPGGTFHRYYKINNKETGNAAPNVPVKVASSTYGLLNILYVSDQNGIVDIGIPSSSIESGDVGASDLFSVTQIGGGNLEEPLTFMAMVVSPEYSKGWFSNKETDGSLSFLNLDFWKGSITELVENSVNTDGPELSIMSDLAKVGVGASLDVSAHVELSITDAVDFTPGASAGVSGMAFLGGSDNYEFPYQIQDNWQSTAQMLLILEGNIDLIDATLAKWMVNLQSFLSDNATLDEAYKSSSLFVERYGQGKVEADLMDGVLGSGLLPVSLDLDMSFSAETSAKTEFKYYNNSNLMTNAMSMSGKLISEEGNGGIILNFPIPDNLENGWSDGFKELFNIDDKESMRTYGIEFARKNNILQWVSLTSKRRQFSYNQGWEESLRYDINGVDVMELMNSWLFAFVSAQFGNVSYNNLVETIFSGIYDLQTDKGGNASITYEKSRSEVQAIDQFGVQIGAGITSIFGASIGSVMYTEQSRSKVIESGRWAFGKHFPSQTYNTNIPDLGISYAEYMQQLADELPSVLKVALGLVNVIPSSGNKAAQEEIEYPIGDNGATITIDPSIIPAGIDSIYCVSWSWYGDSPNKNADDVTKGATLDYIEGVRKASEESYDMTYGIGGFYQFEPYGTELNGQAILALTYSDEELSDINETTLAIYSENKIDRKYEYIGGMLDTENNTITAPIDMLSLYTIGPAVPSGDFDLFADKDTLDINEQDTLLISSSVITMNNTDTVSGELFTLELSLGKAIAEDLDPETDGVQVMPENGKIDFKLVSDNFGGDCLLSINSVNGDAAATLKLFFADTIAPEKPELLFANGVNETIQLEWNASTDNDVIGYKVYFDTDNQEPFEGIAKITGENSPVFVGNLNTYTLNGLFADSSYYVAVTAIDNLGNESPYSEIQFTEIYINDYPVLDNQALSFDGVCNNGTSIGFVTASDPDEGQVLNYSLVSGDYSDHFNIDSLTGEVSLVTSAQKYMGEERIIVRIEDDGPGSLFDEGYIINTMVCAENQKPVVEDSEFTLNYAELLSEHEVGIISATDADVDQSILFQLESSQTGLVIDPQTGVLKISDPTLLEIVNDEITFPLIVHDDGNGWEYDTAQILIKLDRAFTMESKLEIDFSGQCNNNVKAGIVPVRNFLPDEIVNFSITGGDNKDQFQVDNESGEIILVTSSSMFNDIDNLTLRIEDKGSAGTVTDVDLVINLDCYENHAPVAADTTIEFSMANALDGDIIWNIRASDEDEQILSYAFNEEYAGLELSGVNGEITLSNKELLNFETKEIVVKTTVSDNGEGWLSDISTLKMVIPTGIGAKFSEMFEIFPNPASNKLYISAKNDVTRAVIVKVIGITGNVLIEEKIEVLDSQPVLIEIDMLKPGFFILQMESEDFTTWFKFIKEAN